jgi:hypothetical protein
VGNHEAELPIALRTISNPFKEVPSSRGEVGGIHIAKERDEQSRQPPEGENVVHPESYAKLKSERNLRVTHIDHSTQDNKSNNRSDLQNRKSILRFSICLHATKIDRNDNQQEDGDARPARNGSLPILQSDRSSHDLQRHHEEPLHGVVPARGKSPGGIDESSGECGEGPSDWKCNGHFTECLHCTEENCSDKQECD